VGSAILGLLAVKCVIWVVSLGSGTSGGVLAPLLIMGCGLGALESLLLPGGGAAIWPLISMAAVLGGMMRAPFTAVIFALELTHDIHALLPLLIASIAAYAFTVLVMKRSILTEKVARRGFDIFREYGVDPLEKSRVGEVMSRAVRTIPSDLPASEILGRFFSGASKHRGYPVLDGAGKLLGVLTQSDLLGDSSLESGESLTAFDLMKAEPILAYPEETCREAAERMATKGVGRLPVVAASNPKKVIGILTRSDLLKPRLAQFEEERKRERYLGKGSTV
jgi:CBS domain-containing protein